MNANEFREILNEKLSEHKLVTGMFNEERARLVQLEDKSVDVEEAVRILQLVAQTVQQRAHERIAELVSKCLSAVFDEPYQFRISFEQKRGRTEAVLRFQRDGREVSPLDASGGGVVDVAAFALRLSCLMISRPQPRKLLVLDEPMKFVSVEYRDRVRLMLENLASELGVQIIMVTHDPQLKTGTIVELS